MKRIIPFKQFSPISESIEAITSNWFLITNESGFPKKVGGGFLISHPDGSFSIGYKKNEQEEAQIIFYNSPEDSENGKTSISCRIIDTKEKTIEEENFETVDSSNFVEILSTFFDLCDLEKTDKEKEQMFMIGLSKSLKALMKSDAASGLPSSFKAFYNFIQKLKKEKDLEVDPSEDHYEFVKIIEDFFNYHNKKF